MIFAVFAAALAATTVHPSPSQIAAGQRLAQQKCGACHALGQRGASPLPPAPPLRELNRRFDIQALPESLAEGISVGHPKMPQVIWEERDIEAFMAYLSSLQPTKPHVKR